jgi:small-conductance mechanosensitive channel
MIQELLGRYSSSVAYSWIGLVIALIASYAVGRLVAAFVVGIGRRLAKRTVTKWDDEIIEAARRPLRMVVAVALLRLVIDPLRFPPEVDHIAERISYTFLVIGVAWFAVRALDVGAAWLTAHIPKGKEEELETRGLRTQLYLLERVASVIIVVFAGAVILVQFDAVRTFGISLLASAGIAGIVIGLAAQKSLGGVIAGIQLSITQPIRIGDTVVVEGENGTIEEINLTYVIVRVWDGRRLVVPITRFLDQPFQNWTKVSAELLGPVMLSVDYTTPVETVRTELRTFVEKHTAWDGRRCTLQVTDTTDKAMVLRALVSAADADRLFTLRCDVREHLVGFLQRLEGGVYLPRAREEPIVLRRPG